LTREFEIFVETQADTTADNTTLDMTDYVDIADNEAFELHELTIVLDPTEAFPADTECLFQLADSNIQTFVSHADRSSLYVARQTFNQLTFLCITKNHLVQLLLLLFLRLYG